MIMSDGENRREISERVTRPGAEGGWVHSVSHDIRKNKQRREARVPRQELCRMGSSGGTPG